MSGMPEIVSGQKSASGTMPLISSKRVLGPITSGLLVIRLDFSGCSGAIWQRLRLVRVSAFQTVRCLHLGDIL
jgi:hypothetical protein